jgi:hypothetical protein
VARTVSPGDGVADGNTLSVEFDKAGRTTVLGRLVEPAR